MPGTLVFGWLADLISHLRAMLAAVALWITATLLLVFVQAAWVLPAAVVLFALVVGSTQALLRSHLARLVPVERAAEFFGFNALAGRFSAAIGPALFGVIAAATGSQRAAMLSVLAFFLAGAVALSGAPEHRRRKDPLSPG